MYLDVQYVLVAILSCVWVGRKAECPSGCLEVTQEKLWSLSACKVN